MTGQPVSARRQLVFTAVITGTFLLAAGAVSVAEGPSKREKKIYAHHMGCYPAGAAATAYHRSADAQPREVLPAGHRRALGIAAIPAHLMAAGRQRRVGQHPQEAATRVVDRQAGRRRRRAPATARPARRARWRGDTPPTSRRRGKSRWWRRYSAGV